MSSKINIFTDYTIELIKAALSGGKAPLPPEDYSWKFLYLFAVKHKLVSLIYFALITLPKEVQNDIPNFGDFLKFWKQELFFDANRQTEAVTVSKNLADKGIDYVFLKGYVTKHLYPDTVMRSMGDMDILYRTNSGEMDDNSDISSIMNSLGYQHINHTPKDDAYFNPINSTCIEMHRSLVDKGYETEFLYLESIWDRLVQKSEHEYVMTPEDFYIYHVIHMAKHIQHSGIGILPFVDLWLYVNNNDLDWDYLNQEFAILKLINFEKYARLLAYKWFGNEDSKKASHENSGDKNHIEIYNDLDKVNQTLELFSNYIFRSGAYGTETQLEINNIANSSSSAGSGALLRRIFPDKTTMVNYYGDVIEKYPYLIPFYWIYLNVNRLFSKDISFKKKKDIISNISYEQVDSAKTLMAVLFEHIDGLRSCDKSIHN